MFDDHFLDTLILTKIDINKKEKNKRLSIQSVTIIEQILILILYITNAIKFS